MGKYSCTLSVSEYNDVMRENIVDELIKDGLDVTIKGQCMCINWE